MPTLTSAFRGTEVLAKTQIAPDIAGVITKAGDDGILIRKCEPV